MSDSVHAIQPDEELYDDGNGPNQIDADLRQAKGLQSCQTLPYSGNPYEFQWKNRHVAGHCVIDDSLFRFRRGASRSTLLSPSRARTQGSVSTCEKVGVPVYNGARFCRAGSFC